MDGCLLLNLEARHWTRTFFDTNTLTHRHVHQESSVAVSPLQVEQSLFLRVLVGNGNGLVALSRLSKIVDSSSESPPGQSPCVPKAADQVAAFPLGVSASNV